ncbi:MAG: class I SAM-dependent methyltransferase [Proteobacteria bacterium]|nr:class I SAM-dependent methyltransferase [Pseudomonadota bacterium]
MKTYDELKQVADSFFDACRSLTKSHPWLVCLAMHEYARNTYPEDPYIPFERNVCPTERLHTVTSNLIQFLDVGSRMGSYGLPHSRRESDGQAEVKEATGRVYGRLWSKFTPEQLVEKARDILAERLSKNGIPLEVIRGKRCVDVGCGSGRFSFALRMLGAESVTGIDYGTPGLGIGEAVAKGQGITNVEFQTANILDLPFDDESFDFTYSNGVIHHSEDMEKGLSELFRVTKKGGRIWLYIYADGGIFWYSRKVMPEILKEIPQEYTMMILDSIGMPSDRFIFSDNWYVPIERHTSLVECRRLLEQYNPQAITRLEHGRDTDLEDQAIFGGGVGAVMYGDGELRFLIVK